MQYDYSSLIRDEAIRRLKRGQIIAFPTDTVYALAGNVELSHTLSQLYNLKNRPGNLPMAVLIAHRDHIGLWVEKIPKIAYQLMAKVWPGSGTLIFEKKKPLTCQTILQ